MLTKRMMPRLIVAAAAVSCAFASTTACAAGSDWREITIGHFHIYSTLRDSRTREVARQLQVFEKTAGELIHGPDPLPDTPTLVYLLDDADFNHFAADRPGLGGFFAERPYYNVMVINGDLDFDFAKVTVLHEYTHYIQRNTQQIKMPPWYVEGYAELISSFQLQGNNVTIGGAPRGIGIDLAHWIPIERILAVKQSDPEYRAERLMHTFYGEAWALVHFLVFDNEEFRRRTGRYLVDVDAGLAEPEAFAASFSFDKKTLDTEVRKLVLKRTIHVKRFIYDNPITADDAPVAHLTVAQADAAFVRMLFMIDPRKPALGALSAEALKENPTDPSMRALAARVAAHRDEPVEIGDLVGALVADPAASATMRIDIADALLTRPGSTLAQARQAAQVLEPVVRLDNPVVEAVALWASAAFLAGDAPASLIPALEAASRRVPHNTKLLAYLAAANVAIGDLGKARDWYNRIILVSTSPEQRLWAQKQADSPRLQEQQPAAQ